MVTSPYGAAVPSLVNAMCGARKASREACPTRSLVSLQGDDAPMARENVRVSPDDGARCTRLMHMWTADERASNGDVTTMLRLYLVDHYESHGERTHVVSFDASGWRCIRSEQCGAVAIARVEHERIQRLNGGSP